MRMACKLFLPNVSSFSIIRLGLELDNEALAAPKLDRVAGTQLLCPINCVAVVIADARVAVGKMPVMSDRICAIVCHWCGPYLGTCNPGESSHSLI
jgi:hypothetical protein